MSDPVLLSVEKTEPLSDAPGLPVPNNAIRHSCGEWWTGTGAAHCGGCHRTFTSVSGFTAHRKRGVCTNPESLGMVVADRKWFGWAMPGTWNGPEDDDA